MNPARVNEILSLYQSSTGMYFGEPVTQTEHALQCAELARQVGAGDLLIAAALLHDIGHLLAPGTELGSIDHAELGAAYLRTIGANEEIAEIVLGHVQAKRYLTRTNPAYLSLLSEASIETLRLQGGPMSTEEAASFPQDPYFQRKLQLRSWDEQAKIPGLNVPGLETYRYLLESV